MNGGINHNNRVTDAEITAAVLAYLERVTNLLKSGDAQVLAYDLDRPFLEMWIDDDPVSSAMRTNEESFQLTIQVRRR